MEVDFNRVEPLPGLRRVELFRVTFSGARLRAIRGSSDPRARAYGAEATPCRKRPGTANKDAVTPGNSGGKRKEGTAASTKCSSDEGLAGQPIPATKHG